MKTIKLGDIADFKQYNFNLKKDIVDESLIIVPTQTVLEKYNEQVSGFYESIMYNAKQSNELRALRDWLLPMLMTGQATVKDKGAS